MNDRDIIPFLEHLALKSGRVINENFNRPDLQIEWKEDDTPVTYADRKAEEILREEIEKAFPDHGIIGEEFPNVREDAEFNWVLDPIDGTRAYAAGSPHFGTLICLRQGNLPLWSAIHLSAIGQLYIGNNKSAWCNNHPIAVRETAELKDCFLLTTDPRTPPQIQSADGWHSLLGATGQYRSWGDCFGYALVASGRADIMCDPELKIWDLAPLLPVLRGAGAAVSDWQGNAAGESDSLVVCHPRHQAKIIFLLNPVA